MLQKYFLFLLSLLLLGAGCQKADQTREQTPTSSNSQIFCGPDGELTRTPVIQSHRSYCIQTQKTEPELNTPLDYSFAVIDDRGERLKNFQVVHEKIMHVIIVRNDLNEFQHIHPEFDTQTGTFTLKGLTFKNDGAYRIYFDFTPQNAQMGPHGDPLGVTLSEVVAVGDSSKNNTPNLSDTEKVKNVDKFKVTLSSDKDSFVSGEENKLYFQVEGKNNEPIEHVDRYLGALGHLVIIKEGTYEYIHAHPQKTTPTNRYNRIPFVVAFPEEGNYKMFLEFKHWGKVYTAEYGVTVGQGESTPEMDHQERMTH